jgi:transposase
MFYLGIDIAKASFHVTLVTPEGKRKNKRCDNTAAGHQELLAWLGRQGVTQLHACLEATGTYGAALATFLHQQGYTVSVVNPKIIAHYAQSKLSRAKTDQADGNLIAEYCRKEQPVAWTPLPPAVKELQGLVRRLESLQEMHQMERNRLLAGEHPEAVRASLEAHLAYLDQERAATQQQIRDHLEGHPELKQARDLLLSIPGIGEKTVASLLAELGLMEQFGKARQVAAFSGLTPRPYESGTSVKKRESFCKLGSARLRKALYFPAMSALRHNPLVQALGARLRAAGKGEMVVLGAAMRKLLHLAYGVLKSGKPFDPAWTASLLAS